ncbi:hypothetical protein V6N12_031464 [Hibiscus sabdariffa]
MEREQDVCSLRMLELHTFLPIIRIHSMDIEASTKVADAKNVKPKLLPPLKASSTTTPWQIQECGMPKPEQAMYSQGLRCLRTPLDLTLRIQSDIAIY